MRDATCRVHSRSVEQREQASLESGPGWSIPGMGLGRWLETSVRAMAGHWLDWSGHRVERWLDVVVPAITDQVLERAHLTEAIARHVDLDAVVAGVDLDAAARRLDIDEIVTRVDVDAIARRLDLDAVLARVDVNGVVENVDLDAIVQRLDMDSILDRLDLTSIVLGRVDLDAVVAAVVARLDLITLAEEVIDGVDFPEIIRESTGSMASETVRGARMQGIHADEAVGHAVDRLLRRGTRPPTAGSGRLTVGGPDIDELGEETALPREAKSPN